MWRKGVKGISIITSGFSEVGEHELEEQVVKTAREYGMRIIGPNIIGVLSNSGKMNASFASQLPMNGTAGLISQSGALLIAMIAATYTRRVGFDKMLSIGNQSDLDFADLVTYLAEDDVTSCITLYVEGIKDGARFMEAARNCDKPIIALKAGTSAHGAAAAASHTGSLAGAAKVYEAAFKQVGVTQADDLNDLFDRTLALSLQPPACKATTCSSSPTVAVLAFWQRTRLKIRPAPPQVCPPTRGSGRTQKAYARLWLRQEPG